MGSRPACSRPRPVFLEAKAKILQGQGQWSLRPTKKDMFKAQVFYFY